MTGDRLKNLIHGIDHAQSKASGTFNVILTDAPFQLPPLKGLNLIKVDMPGTPVVWTGTRLGNVPVGEAQYTSFSFKDSLPDGKYQVSFATVSMDCIHLSHSMQAWEATEGEFTFTSDRTPGNERMYGTFTQCKMVLESNPTRFFYMSGDFDLNNP